MDKKWSKQKHRRRLRNCYQNCWKEFKEFDRHSTLIDLHLGSKIKSSSATDWPLLKYIKIQLYICLRRKWILYNLTKGKEHEETSREAAAEGTLGLYWRQLRWRFYRELLTPACTNISTLYLNEMRNILWQQCLLLSQYFVFVSLDLPTTLEVNLLMILCLKFKRGIDWSKNKSRGIFFKVESLPQIYSKLIIFLFQKND